jgi:hypothetical protein
MMVALHIDRQTALALLRSILDHAIAGNAPTAIEAWLAHRSEDPGGFLWLAGQLGLRPSILDDTIRSIAMAPLPRRRFLKWRLDTLSAKCDDERER